MAGLGKFPTRDTFWKLEGLDGVVIVIVIVVLLHCCIVCIYHHEFILGHISQVR